MIHSKPCETPNVAEAICTKVQGYKICGFGLSGCETSGSGGMWRPTAAFNIDTRILVEYYLLTGTTLFKILSLRVPGSAH